MIIVI